jgi:predicted Zn-dependent peptidase
VDTGIFGAYAGVNSENVRKSTELIFKEIARLKHMYVDPNELQDAKEHTKGSLILASESNDNQMVRLAQNETHFGRYIPLEEIANNIESVTRDDILDLAESLFQKRRFALTILGPVTHDNDFKDILTL